MVVNCCSWLILWCERNLGIICAFSFLAHLAELEAAGRSSVVSIISMLKHYYSSACFPREGWHFFVHRRLCGRGSPGRASFTPRRPIWNRNSSGDRKPRPSEALTPPPQKTSRNLITYVGHREERLVSYVCSEEQCGCDGNQAVPPLTCWTPAVILNSSGSPQTSLRYYCNCLKMSVTRLQRGPNFPPFCICGQVWAPLALSSKLDSVHFPHCLRRKVLAHPRVFRLRFWLMGKLLRIIVLRADVFPSPLPVCESQ